MRPASTPVARRSTRRRLPRDWFAGSELLASGDEIFSREGTQFAVPLTLAARVTRALSLSGTLNLERGVIRERVDHFFLDPVDSLAYRRSSLVREDDFSGTSASFGLQWRPTGALSLGAVFTTPWDYVVTRRQEVYNVSGVVDSSYTVRMPAAWGVGASARLAARWRVGADYEWRGLSDLRGRPDWEACRGGRVADRIRVRARRGRACVGAAGATCRCGSAFRGASGATASATNRSASGALPPAPGFVFNAGGGRVDRGAFLRSRGRS